MDKFAEESFSETGGTRAQIHTLGYDTSSKTFGGESEEDNLAAGPTAQGRVRSSASFLPARTLLCEQVTLWRHPERTSQTTIPRRCVYRSIKQTQHSAQ